MGNRCSYGKWILLTTLFYFSIVSLSYADTECPPPRWSLGDPMAQCQLLIEDPARPYLSARGYVVTTDTEVIQEEGNTIDQPGDDVINVVVSSYDLLVRPDDIPPELWDPIAPELSIHSSTVRIVIRGTATPLKDYVVQGLDGDTLWYNDEVWVSEQFIIGGIDQVEGSFSIKPIFDQDMEETETIIIEVQVFGSWDSCGQCDTFNCPCEDLECHSCILYVPPYITTCGKEVSIENTVVEPPTIQFIEPWVSSTVLAWPLGPIPNNLGDDRYWEEVFHGLMNTTNPPLAGENIQFKVLTAPGTSAVYSVDFVVVNNDYSACWELGLGSHIGDEWSKEYRPSSMYYYDSGYKTIVATATDEIGVTASALMRFMIVGDNSFVITTPEDGSALATGAIRIDATHNYSGSGDNWEKVEFRYRLKGEVDWVIIGVDLDEHQYTETGNWDIIWPDATPGEYELSAKGYYANDTDGDGEIDQTGSYESAPVVSIVVGDPHHARLVSPVAGEALPSYGLVELAAKATDYTQIANVAFYDNDQLLGQGIYDQESDTYTCNWHSSRADRIYSLVVQWTTNEGVVSRSEPIDFIVDNGGVLLTAPIGGAAAVGDIKLSATALNLHGKVERMRFFAIDSEGNVSFIDEETIMDSRGVFRVLWRNVPHGIYQLYAEAILDDGSSVQSDLNSMTVLDLPTISWVNPNIPSKIPINSSIYLSVSVSVDGTNGNSVDRIEFYDDGILIGEGLENSGYYDIAWQCDSYDMHRLSAKVFDTAGLMAQTDVLETKVIGRDDAWFITPVEEALYEAGDDITLELLTDYSNIDTVLFFSDDGVFPFQDDYIDLDNVPDTNYLSGYGLYNVLWEDVPAGLYEIKAILVFSDSSQISPIPVNITVTDKPQVSFVRPASDLTCFSNHPQWIEANASDSDGTIGHVEFYYGATHIQSVYEPPYRISWTPEEVGVDDLIVYAVDNHGVLSDPALVSVTVQQSISAVVQASPGNGSAAVSWSFWDIHSGREIDLDVAMSTLKVTDAMGTVVANVNGLERERWWYVDGLENDQNYTIVLTGYDSSGNSFESDPVQVTPIQGVVDKYEVTSMTSSAGTSEIYLSWRYDSTHHLLSAEDDIGFLIHRMGPDGLKLIAALPLHSDTENDKYFYVDSGLVSGTQYEYTITVIDRANHQSQGIEIQAETLLLSEIENSEGFYRAIFQDGVNNPLFEKEGRYWTGASFGAYSDVMTHSALPEGAIGVADGELMVPAQSDISQMYQAIIPSNQVISVNFQLAISGDQHNTGVKVIELKTLEGILSEGVSLTFYQDHIEIGDTSIKYYHGGLVHDYTLLLAGNSLQMYVDGHELIKKELSYKYSFEQSNEDYGFAFLRFGAVGKSEISTTWQKLEWLIGAVDYFSEGTTWIDADVPEAVTNLAVDTSVNGQITATWDQLTSCPDLATYRVTISDYRNYDTLYVSGSETQPSITIPVNIPTLQTIYVEAINSYGNIGFQGDGVQFRAEVLNGVGTTYETVDDYISAGFVNWDLADTGITDTNLGGGDYRIFFDAGRYLISPELNTGGGYDTWSLELTYAIKPTETQGGMVMLDDSAIIIFNDDKTSESTLWIKPTSIVLGNEVIAEFASGSEFHTLRLINNANTLQVFVDGLFLGMTSGYNLENFSIGDIYDNGSKLILDKLVTVYGAANAPEMGLIGLDPEEEPVSEIVLSANTSSSDGTMINWLTLEPDISVVEVQLITGLPSGNDEALTSEPFHRAFLPARYLNVLTEDTFIPVNTYEMNKTGNPFQYIVKVIPFNKYGVPGIGSATVVRDDYNQSGSSYVGANIESGFLANTDWQYNNQSLVTLPSYVVPVYLLKTGMDNSLVDDINETIVPDGFESFSPADVPDGDWNFSAYVKLGGFKGTFFEAIPYNGTTVTLSQKYGVLYFNNTPIAEFDGYDKKHIDLRFINIGVNQYNVEITINHNEFVLTHQLLGDFNHSNAVVRFGNLAYDVEQLHSNNYIWFEGMWAIQWSQVELNSSIDIIDDINNSGVWTYFPQLVNGNSILPPEVLADNQIGMLDLRVEIEESGTAVDPNEMTLGDGLSLSDIWTAEFTAKQGTGLDGKVYINGAERTVVICPDSGEWKTYRVIRTPEATSVLVDGKYLHPSSASWYTITRDVSDTVDMRIKIFPDQYVEANIQIRDIKLVNNGISQQGGDLLPIRGLFYTKSAEITSGGQTADLDKSKIVFAHTYLSTDDQNLNWKFDTSSADYEVHGIDDVVSKVYTPGTYALVVQDSEPITEYHSVELQNIIIENNVSSSYKKLAEPENLIVTPSHDTITLKWKAGPGERPDNYDSYEYMVFLIDPDTGALDIDIEGDTTGYTIIDGGNNTVNLAIPIPIASRGKPLDLIIYAQTRDVVGTLTGQSKAFRANVSTNDNYSVILKHGASPIYRSKGGDRVIELSVSDHPKDIHGYILWKNDPEEHEGEKSVPIRSVVKLGPDAIERIDALLGRDQQDFLHLNNDPSVDQIGILSNLRDEEVLNVSLADRKLFFFNENKGNFDITTGCVQNSNANEFYLFTLDPYDDALPSNETGLPSPNLGSTENDIGLNSYNVPGVRGASLLPNTVTVEGRAINQQPVFIDRGLILSTSLNGEPLATVGQLLEMYDVPSWITNDAYVDYPIVTTDMIALYYRGPEASDRTIVEGRLYVRQSNSRQEIAVIPNDVVVRDNLIVRYDDCSLSDDPTGLPEEIYYDEASRKFVLQYDSPNAFDVAVFKEGYNYFELLAKDADGATSSIRPDINGIGMNGLATKAVSGAVIYDNTPPSISYATEIINGKLLGKPMIVGRYSDASAIKDVTVMVNGNSITLDGNNARVANGTFRFDLTNEISSPGQYEVVVLMEDVAGNVINPTNPDDYDRLAKATLSFEYFDHNLGLVANTTREGESIKLNVTVNGVVLPPAYPHMLITGVRVNGQIINVTPSFSTNPDYAYFEHTLANEVNIAPGYNYIIVEVDVQINGTDTITLEELITHYENGVSELPELTTTNPKRLSLLPGIFNDTSGLIEYTFNSDLYIRYFDLDPGVDPANVYILYSNDNKSTWIDVTSKFDITGTQAKIKSTENLIVGVPDSGSSIWLKVLLPEIGLPANIATFDIQYIIEDSSNSVHQPLVNAISQFVFEKGSSNSVILWGYNLGNVKNVKFIYDLQSTGINLPIVRRNSADAPGGREYIEIQFSPPDEGTGFFYLSDISGTSYIKQTLVPIYIVDVDRSSDIDSIIRDIEDNDGDGLITPWDLDTDGDGNIDIDYYQPTSLSDDDDGDNIPDDLDEDPETYNSLFEPTAANPEANVDVLGDMTSDANGWIVLIKPQLTGNLTWVGNRLIDLVGLVPHDTLRVEIIFDEQIEYATLTRSQLYSDLLLDPLRFEAKNINLELDDPNQVTIRQVREGGLVTNKTISLQVDDESPGIVFKFMEQGDKILGYHSLYNSLPLSDLLVKQQNYQIFATFSDNVELDIDSFELRLDNRIISQELYDVQYVGGNTSQVAFRLKDNERINIHSMLENSFSNYYLTVNDFLYNLHNLRVSIRDKFGRIANSTRVFEFDHGEKVTIQFNKTIDSNVTEEWLTTPSNGWSKSRIYSWWGHSLGESSWFDEDINYYNRNYSGFGLNVGLYGVVTDCDHLESQQEFEACTQIVQEAEDAGKQIADPAIKHGRIDWNDYGVKDWYWNYIPAEPEWLGLEWLDDPAIYNPYDELTYQAHFLTYDVCQAIGGDECSTTNYQAYQHMKFGHVGSVSGPIAVDLIDYPTYEGGAIEQLYLADDTEFNAYIRMPSERRHESSSYIIAVSSEALSGDANVNLDLASSAMFVKAEDCFNTNHTVDIPITIDINPSSRTGGTYQRCDPCEDEDVEACIEQIARTVGISGIIEISDKIKAHNQAVEDEDYDTVIALQIDFYHYARSWYEMNPCWFTNEREYRSYANNNSCVRDWEPPATLEIACGDGGCEYHGCGNIFWYFSSGIWWSGYDGWFFEWQSLLCRVRAKVISEYDDEEYIQQHSPIVCRVKGLPCGTNTVCEINETDVEREGELTIAENANIIYPGEEVVATLTVSGGDYGPVGGDCSFAFDKFISCRNWGHLDGRIGPDDPTLGAYGLDIVFDGQSGDLPNGLCVADCLNSDDTYIPPNDYQLGPGPYEAEITGLLPALESMVCSTDCPNSLRSPIRNTESITQHGTYFYGLCFLKDLPIYVIGIVANDGGRPALDDAKYQFVQVSRPHANISVSEGHFKVSQENIDSIDQTVIDFGLFIVDPVMQYSEREQDAPITIYVNGEVPAYTYEVIVDDEDQLDRKYQIKLNSLPVKYGWNQYDIRVVNSVGVSTGMTYRVKMGDEDGLRTTQGDLYVIDSYSVSDAMAVPRVHTTTVFGEFLSDAQEMMIQIDNNKQQDVRLSRNGRFGRYARPLMALDPVAMGDQLAISKVDQDGKALSTGEGLPVVIQSPGSEVDLITGRQKLKLFIEGLQFEQGEKATRILAGDEFELHAYKEKGISESVEFELAIMSSSGAAVELGDGIENIAIAPVESLTEDIFSYNGEIKGEHFTSPLIKIVGELPEGARYRFNVETGNHELVLRPGEFVTASFGSLDNYAQCVAVADIDVFEAVTGVTPSIGRSIPIPGMSVHAETLLHNRQLKVTHTDFVIPGRRLSFGVSHTYRSGMPGDAYLGEGWYGNWNQYFYKTADAYIYHGPDGREDAFYINNVAGQTPTLVVPLGYTCKAEVSEWGKAIVVTQTDGSMITYSAITNQNMYRIRSVVDRYGNELRYEYGESDLLSHVIDDMDRKYEFFFEENQEGGIRLDRVIDFDGMTYHYFYQDGSGRLEEIETQGLSVIYQYSSSDSAGREYLENILINGITYLHATYELDSPEVATMTWGGTVTDSFTRTGSKVNHNDTNGVTTEYEFSTTPNKVMLCDSIMVDPGGYALQTQYTYTAELLTQQITRPLGNTVSWTYDSGTSDSIDKRGYANVLTKTMSPGSRANPSAGVTGNSTDDLRIANTYYTEDKYYQLHTSSQFHKPGDTPVVATAYDYDYSQPDESIITITTKAQDESDLVSHYGFNEYGQIIKSLTPDGTATIYEYYKTNDAYENIRDIEGYLYRVAKSKNGGNFSSNGINLTSWNSYDESSGLGADWINTYTGRDIYGRVISQIAPKGGATVYTFNSLGQLKEIRKPPLDGTDKKSIERVTYYYHIPYDLVEQITHYNPVAEGTVSAPEYESVVSDTYYTYDNLLRIKTQENTLHALPATTTYQYESGKERLSYIQRYDGGYDHFVYDSAGRKSSDVVNHNNQSLQTKLPIGGISKFYDYNNNSELALVYILYGDGNVNSDVKPPSGQHEFVYIHDWAGRLAQTFDNVRGVISEKAWNNKGQLVNAKGSAIAGSNIHPTGDVSYTYYTNGDLKETIDWMRDSGGSHKYTFATDYISRTTTTTLPNGDVYTEEYDSLGDNSSSNYAGFNVNRKYDDDGNMTRYSMGSVSIDDTGNPLYSYNEANDLVSVTRPEIGGTQNYAPSGSGAPGVIEDEIGTRTINLLDESGSVRNVVEDADSSVNGRQTPQWQNREEKRSIIYRDNDSGQNNDGQATKYEWDLAGRVVNREYKYDAHADENTTAITDFVGNTDVSEQFEYDQYGHLAVVTQKDSTELHYTYYPRNSSAIESRDRLKEITDGSNKLREILSYNQFGHPTEIREYYTPGNTGNYVKTERQYHGEGGAGDRGPGFGKLKSETTTIYADGIAYSGTGRTVAYEYNDNGRLKSVTYPDGSKIDYTYENGGLLDKITRNSGATTILDIDRDANYKVPTDKYIYNSVASVEFGYKSMRYGLISDIKYGNDYLTTFDYDQRGLKSQTGQWVNSSTDYSRQYQYDGLRRLRKADDYSGGALDKFAVEVFPLDKFENRVEASIVDGKLLTYTASDSRNEYTGFSDFDDVVSMIGAAQPSNTSTGNYVRINFQVAAGDVQGFPNYLADTGAQYNAQGSPPYGWVGSSNGSAVDSNNPDSPDERYDTYMSLAATPWKVTLSPNTTYFIRIVAGNPDYDSLSDNDDYKIVVNTQPVVDGTPTDDNPWVVGTAAVTSDTNGDLIISSGTGAVANKICFLEIVPQSDLVSGGGGEGLPYAHTQRGYLEEDSQYYYSADLSNRFTTITRKSFADEITTHELPEKVQYIHDAFGRRVARIYTGHDDDEEALGDPDPWPDEFVVYDGVKMIEESDLDLANNVFRRYYYEAAINKPILIEEDANDNGTVTDSADHAFIVLTDDRGTVMGVATGKSGTFDSRTHSPGDLIEQLHYNSTGLIKSHDCDGNLNNGTGENPYRSQYVRFGWTGMYKDAFTGRYHTHFRDYDPVHNRWLSEDPAGYMDGLNLYANYAGVNGVDVLGLDLDDIDAAIENRNRPLSERKKHAVYVQNVTDAPQWSKDLLHEQSNLAMGLTLPAEATTAMGEEGVEIARPHPEDIGKGADMMDDAIRNPNYTSVEKVSVFATGLGTLLMGVAEVGDIVSPGPDGIDVAQKHARSKLNDYYSDVQAKAATRTKKAVTGQTGPGQLIEVSEKMSARAAKYQMQITGLQIRYGYVVDGVKFDGFDSSIGVLLDAKGPGYAGFVKNGQYAKFFTGAEKMVEQAERQLRVAKGTKIKWHFAEKAAADATRSLFRKYGISGIEVVVTPPR